MTSVPLEFTATPATSISPLVFCTRSGGLYQRWGVRRPECNKRGRVLTNRMRRPWNSSGENPASLVPHFRERYLRFRLISPGVGIAWFVTVRPQP